MSVNGGLPARVAAVLASARVAYGAHPVVVPMLDAMQARLDEPLRVAIAGRVKTGKSTLLNALVGHGLAAVDAGECTRHVTWYVHGRTYDAQVEVDGVLHRVPLRRREGSVDVDLSTVADDRVARIVVQWPSPMLTSMSLIDTPGMGTLNERLDDRSRSFLVPGDDASAADAVIYLTRHMHAHDVRFLEAFHDDDAGRPSPMNTIGVVSRADEIGAARSDAMDSARRVAGRYAHDLQIRRLCQTVVPVAGLLGFGAALLTEHDFVLLGRLADASDADADDLLMSCDRLSSRPSAIEINPLQRAHLVDRLGLFGVRVARDHLRSKTVRSAPALASELRRISGVDELRELLATRFATRTGLLKSQALLAGLDRIVRTWPVEGHGLVRELEMVEASAHELDELRLLVAARSGAIELGAEDSDEVDRIVERSGLDARQRLDLPEDATAADVDAEVARGVERWRTRAEHPFAPSAMTYAAGVMVRSYEGMLARPGQPSGSSAQLPVPGAI